MIETPRRDALAARFGGMEFLRTQASSFGACAPMLEVLEEFGKLERELWALADAHLVVCERLDCTRLALEGRSRELIDETRRSLLSVPDVEMPPCRDV